MWHLASERLLLAMWSFIIQTLAYHLYINLAGQAQHDLPICNDWKQHLRTLEATIQGSQSWTLPQVAKTLLAVSDIGVEEFLSSSPPLPPSHCKQSVLAERKVVWRGVLELPPTFPWNKILAIPLGAFCTLAPSLLWNEIASISGCLHPCPNVS